LNRDPGRPVDQQVGKRSREVARRNETSRQLEALRVEVILAGKPALDEERAPGALASTQQVSAGGDRYRRSETPRRLPGGTRHSQ
jgi:hypothetical protein